METRKLYYEDSHLREFSADVLSCEETEKGFAVILNATAFYPEGGGQACDLGTLGDANVLDVREKGEAIVHLCDKPLEAGSQVTGTIDWARRFDLMQQHSGEHMVSGVIHRRYGYHNVGFHMGEHMITIDFDGVVPAEDLPAIEAEVNAGIWENLPIRCWYPEPEILPTVGYRTKKELPWPVRIVDIQGADRCACCGIHTAFTGEVGLVKLTSCVKLRGGVRIVMRCGGRALRRVQEIYEQNRRISQQLSAQLHETADAVKKLGDALAEEKLRSNELQKEVFNHIADGYANCENVLHFADNLTSVQIRELADVIAGKVRGFAAVFSGTGNCYSYCLATRNGDLRELGKAMNSALQGRGGGKPNFQQGSVQTQKTHIEAFFSVHSG